MKYNSRNLHLGFTLIELLVVISIISLLSTMAMVNFAPVRAKARDTKRLADTREISTALELYSVSNNSYPPDGHPGIEGAVLGFPETAALSDDGFALQAKGALYMLRVPRNPKPGGTPYVYRSLHRDGSDCDSAPCDFYALLFSLEGAQPQAGVLAGIHAVTPTGLAGPEGGYAAPGVFPPGAAAGFAGVQSAVLGYAEEVTETVAAVADNSRVEQIAEAGVSPAATAAAVASAAAATHSAAVSLGTLPYVFLQPLLLLGRRKKKTWGVVYNSLSKLPEDLVIVRLRQADTGRLLKTSVTDAEGRFSFLVHPGRYVFEVVKKEFVFPSRNLAGQKEDGKFHDLYFGQTIEVTERAALLVPHIPIDPEHEPAPDQLIIKKDAWRKIQHGAALAGPALGAFSFFVKPSLLVGLMLLAQIFAYLLFRRLAILREIKSWGMVFDEATKKPVAQAILRIFALPYNKLLETQVSDRLGRYHFRVGSGKFFLTAAKPGYLKTESEPLDLSGAAEPTVIVTDVPMRRAS